MQPIQKNPQKIQYIQMVIVLDFDGTCVTHSFPEIGKGIGAEIVLSQLTYNGHSIVLSTMRCDDPEGKFKQKFPNGYEVHSGMFLKEAVEWFRSHGIPLYGIQTNPMQHTWTSSPKAYGQLIIDDAALGTPLVDLPKISDREFVNWAEVARFLCNKELFTVNQYFAIIEDLSKFFKKTYNVSILTEPITTSFYYVADL